MAGRSLRHRSLRLNRRPRDSSVRLDEAAAAHGGRGGLISMFLSSQAPQMYRETRQRRAIRRALKDAGHPLSPTELLEAAREHVSSLGIATVYRNLKSLQAEGRIVPVELPGEPARYEMAGKDHHHHFHCRKCDKVYEVEGCPGNLNSVTPTGFELENHEFVLYGLCDVCVA